MNLSLAKLPSRSFFSLFPLYGSHTVRRVLVLTALAHTNPFFWFSQSQAIEAHLSLPIYLVLSLACLTA